MTPPNDTPPELTDRQQLLRNRQRSHIESMFLHQCAIEEVNDRLLDVKRPFKNIAIVTGFCEIWQKAFPDAFVTPDDSVLNLQHRHYDLVIHAMSLHWANDPVGQMIQCHRALISDGFFIAVLFGGDSLNELRMAISEVEIASRDGLSPHIVPMGEIRDLGGLLSRTGFALPVADSLKKNVTYQNLRALIADLRLMGERNALSQRQKTGFSRKEFRQIEQVYQTHFSTEGGRLQASAELIFLSGWTPDPSQQKPLRPGSAISRLSDALGVDEINTK